jgi:hypothetical protein
MTRMHATFVIGFSVSVMVWLLVVEPAKKCADAGGLPVLGIGRVVCAEQWKQ